MSVFSLCAVTSSATTVALFTMRICIRSYHEYISISEHGPLFTVPSAQHIGPTLNCKSKQVYFPVVDHCRFFLRGVKSKCMYGLLKENYRLSSRGLSEVGGI